MSIDESQVADLIERRKAAEKVVQGMADGPIKEKAFEVAFQHLLIASSQPVTTKRRRAKTSRKHEGESSATARAKRLSGPRRQLTALLEDGFFDDWKALPNIVQELRVRGHSHKQEELSTPLQRMTRAKILRRELGQGERGRQMYFYRKL